MPERSPFPDALAVVDSALRAGIPKCVLWEAASGSPRTGRSAALRAIAAGSAKSANAFESALKALTIEAGVTVEPQLECLPYLRVDLGSRILRLVIEAESWAYHGDRKPFDKDVRRYTLLVRHHWIVARFLWGDVMYHPERVRREIREIADWCAELRQLEPQRPKSA